MATAVVSSFFILLLLLIIVSPPSSAAAAVAGSESNGRPHFNRSSLPPGFLIGVASSAYQYEGAAFEDGKGPSIWDTFAHNSSDKIADRSNGDVALDFYHRYKDDIKLMKYLGVESFRMSISWPRILPRGKLSGGVNKKGIAFYNNVFNELIANGITPFVTLFHWDLPQALEDEYKGFLSPRVIDDYRDFADICFKEFGDRIKHWITFNEPFVFINGGYDGGLVGNLAPGRCTSRAKCRQGNSATEPYIVGHHILLSHAVAVELYKKKYQATQKGKIGITQISHWMVPSSKNKLDHEAAYRALDFMYGWFMDPIVDGDYPKIMRSIVGHRLPQFTKSQSSMLKGSFDFIGLNYYTGKYASPIVNHNQDVSSTTDNMVNLTSSINGVPIGEATGSPAFLVYPQGLYELLVYTKKKYNHPEIYITETGMPDAKNGNVQTNDTQRVNFYDSHLQAVQRSIQHGANVKGFFAWTFLDCLEWGSGFTIRFGLCYVDYKNGLKRIPKESALWFKKFLGKN
ncbi:beta-glucosidase 12-like [Andrographis paniculata]|uniref:beta-glucosidase 12-like n=1 Tax=Andrographis paniculata TaxID=175694 RepID=UPI0021E7B97C|nr:beta-glucosidase 12-like [Andrographis paniculata]